MGLQRAKNLGGDYLDLRQLVADGPRLVVFRILEFKAPEPGKYGPKLPVRVDVLIADGPRMGEVYRGEEYFGAITSTLRGVRNPKAGNPIPAPTNAVGADLAVRLKLGNEGQGNETVFGDEPSDGEYERIGEVYAAVGGEGPWTGRNEGPNVAPAAVEPQPQPQAPVEQPQAQPEPVAVGAVNGAAAGARPWER